MAEMAFLACTLGAPRSEFGDLGFPLLRSHGLAVTMLSGAFERHGYAASSPAMSTGCHCGFEPSTPSPCCSKTASRLLTASKMPCDV